jgi:hypothetical protein
MISPSLLGVIASARQADPFFSSVILLVTADGALGSEPVDSSSYANAAAGTSAGVEITDADAIFGTKSFTNVGLSTDYLRFANDGDYSIGTDDMTLEFFFKNESGIYSGMCFQYFAANPSSQNNYMQMSTNTQLGFGCAYAGGSISGGLSVPAINGAWHHYAIVRSGTTSVRQYLDGSLLATRTVGSGGGISDDGFRIGGGGSGKFNGYMDQFRVTRGVQRYTGSSYEVPTAPFPTY